MRLQRTGDIKDSVQKYLASRAPSTSWVPSFNQTIEVGLAFLAIGAGVKSFPPALFGGTRYLIAGLLLLSFVAVRRKPWRLPWRELRWLALVAVFLFLTPRTRISVDGFLFGAEEKS